jgi:haloalkane dehalogenase
VKATVAGLIDAWRAKGRPFVGAGVSSVVWDEGSGEPVVCLHGVQVSSFVYRKLLPELGRRALRAVAFDFPGVGFI